MGHLLEVINDKKKLQFIAIINHEIVVNLIGLPNEMQKYLTVVQSDGCVNSILHYVTCSGNFVLLLLHL